MADLEQLIQQGESIKDKKLKLFGMRVSGASIMGLFALLSTLVGSLYGGFLLYQKVESLASLDLGSISSQMLKTEAAVTRIEEHANSIKIELKKDMSDLRSGQWNLESKVDGKLQSIDTRLTAFETKLDGKLQSVDTKLISYDTKLDRFELKVEKTKTDLEKRIQQSLDNPLAY
jgi:Skp family chaperone for outer membrane proteins|tara:strand:+ start:223 stop:744 length:522 start_codon:yes stop_codon:yes gene_type:complete